MCRVRKVHRELVRDQTSFSGVFVSKRRAGRWRILPGGRTCLLRQSARLNGVYPSRKSAWLVSRRFWVQRLESSFQTRDPGIRPPTLTSGTQSEENPRFRRPMRWGAGRIPVAFRSRGELFRANRATQTTTGEVCVDSRGSSRLNDLL